MSTQEQQGEPEQREGLGGRVRRFVDTELSRVRDKGHEADRTPAEHRRADRAPEFDRPAEPDRAYESDRIHESDRAAQQEPVTPYPADAPRRADPAMTPAPVDSGHISPRRDGRGDETRSGPSRGRSSDQTAADAGAERIGLLNDPASLRDRWQQVQGTFVDDPQRAVREASELVERTLREIHTNVTHGQTGDPTSTEDLRVSFQRYREFFQRLLSA